MTLPSTASPITAAAPPTPVASPHIAALDGLRGVAILMVMVFHFHVATWGAGWLDALARAGGNGVNLFFVLSGFLITGILWDAKADDHYLRNFFARRFLRIFPLYYGALFIGLVLLPWLHPVTDPKYAATVRHQVWLWTYTSNFYECWSGRALPLYGHFWSLAVEEHFYLVWPFVVWWSGRRTLMAVCVGCWVAAFAARLALLRAGADPALAVLRLDPCQLDCLAAGAFLALAWRDPDPARAWRWRTPPHRALALSAGLVAGLFLAFPLWAGGYRFLVAVSNSCWSVFFGAGLLTAVAGSPRHWLRRALEWPFMRKLGKYSYGLYVFHWPLGRLWLVLLEKWKAGHPGSAPGGGVVFQTGYFALAAGSSWLAAWVSWRCYEKPFLRLKKHFDYARPSAEPAVTR